MQKAHRAISHGKVFSRQALSSRKGCYGESVMANRFACFMIIGFLVSFQPCKLNALNDSTVSAMMDLNSREWNAELLRNSITPFLV